MTPARLALCLLLLLWLAGCASTPGSDGDRDAGLPSRSNIDLSAIPPAVPHPEPRSKHGNPHSYTVFGKTYYPLTSARGFTQTGIASWYGRDFHGKRTSSGEPYDMYRMTAAHKTLPLPTYVRVTNRDNGRHVIVRVNDRGPFHGDRVIDLSYVAALKLGIVHNGSAPVRIQTVTAADVDPTARRPRGQPRVTAAARRQQTPAQASPAAAKATETRTRGAGGYLQAGAFARHANARKLDRQLRTMGIANVAVLPPGSVGDRLYRVRVGPFNTPHERQTARRRMASKGIPAVLVGH